MQSGKRFRYVTLFCALILSSGAHAGPSPDDIRGVLKTVTGPNSITNPAVTTTAEGYVRFVSAPAGDSFQPSASAKAAVDNGAIASSFLQEHAMAFGIVDPNISFVTNRTDTSGPRTYVHLGQQFKGVPVFGASVVVQMKSDGSIESILSDILRDAPSLYSGAVSTTPAIDAATAAGKAVAALQSENIGRKLTNDAPTLYIFAPDVTGDLGLVRLVYAVGVHGADDAGKPVAELVLVDASNGTIAHRIQQICSSRYREIWNANESPGVTYGTLARSEGAQATGIVDVDQAYDYYGDTYSFYFLHHGRDSIDNHGMRMEATVRYCETSYDCPFENAFWDGNMERMFFGSGYIADDVVGHELTHGVTQFTSGLLYENESGALNEAFSDIWGEFIDLNNGKGNDSAAVRWLHGEDLPSGANRNMKDPNEFGDPAVYHGLYWYYGQGDNGGVHFNSGVCNKFAYLLTDGDLFNGFSVTGLGIDAVADLFYEVQTHLLGPTADYSDFGDQILRAADNLGFSPSERKQVSYALFATNIKKFDGKPLRDFRAEGRAGDNRMALTWRNPTDGEFTGVTIVRNPNHFPENAGDGTTVASVANGSEKKIETPGGATGTSFYYAMFPNAGSAGFNQPLYARGTVGVDVNHFTQSFTHGTDLAYSQITFVPTGAIPTTVPFDHFPNYFNYTTYAAHRSEDAKIAPDFNGTLPVAKEDFYELPMTDDGFITLYPDVPIPLFGHFLNALTLSANGYISAAALEYQNDPLNVSPTLENHFGMLRIAFLFCDLDPNSGGEVWARFLDDRIAITFENVPSFDHSGVGGGLPGNTFVNTVQCELFYSGQIRFTYLNLTAERAVVGLSDGFGMPLDVGDLLAGIADPDPDQTEMDSLPASVALEIQPVPTQFAIPGQTVTFTASALSTVGTPEFSLLQLPADLGVFPATGATVNSTSGVFTWDTTGFSPGVYGVLLKATAGAVVSNQPVAIIVSQNTTPPIAKNLSLTPANPHDSENLVAAYTYSHATLPEGPTVLYWFKNNELMPAFTNQLMVPDEATKPGERWYFQVLPSTIQVGFIGDATVFLRGNLVQSTSVTIVPDLKVDTNGDGKVNSVDLQLVVSGLLGTGDNTVDPDVNGDGNEDASDIQTTINYILMDKH